MGTTGKESDGAGEVDKGLRPNDLFTAAYYNDVETLKKLLFVEPVEEEPPLPEEFDPAEHLAEEDGEELEEEEQGSSPEEQNQPEPDEDDDEEKVAARERMEQRKANEDKISTLLKETGLLTTRRSVVNLRKFGLFVHIEERVGGGSLNHLRDINEGDSAIEQEHHRLPQSSSPLPSLPLPSLPPAVVSLRSCFKTSPHSTFTASPLHWAVLGRSHDAVRYLISLGADTEARCVVFSVTPIELAKINESYLTLKVIEDAVESYRKTKSEAEEKVKARADLITKRKEMVEFLKSERRREAKAQREKEKLEEQREERDEEAEENDDDEKNEQEDEENESG